MVDDVQNDNAFLFASLEFLLISKKFFKVCSPLFSNSTDKKNQCEDINSPPGGIYFGLRTYRKFDLNHNFSLNPASQFFQPIYTNVAPLLSPSYIYDVDFHGLILKKY